MSLNVALAAICVRVRAVLPALGACDVHPGRFDLEELLRVQAKTPAIFAGLLGIRNVENPGTEEADANCVWALFVVTETAPKLSRDEAARNIVEVLIPLVQNERWSLAGTGPATEIKGENLYAGNVGKKGVALWAVTWAQKVRIGASVWDGTGPVPSRLYVGLAPDIGEAHIADYVEVTDLPEEPPGG